jgi:hypothetical protein
VGVLWLLEVVVLQLLEAIFLQLLEFVVVLWLLEVHGTCSLFTIAWNFNFITSRSCNFIIVGSGSFIIEKVHRKTLFIHLYSFEKKGWNFNGNQGCFNFVIQKHPLTGSLWKFVPVPALYIVVYSGIKGQIRDFQIGPMSLENIPMRGFQPLLHGHLLELLGASTSVSKLF